MRKDGSQFEAELSATVIRDAEGTPSSFMALTRDIGERKRMERALRESEERFSRLAQASFEGVAVHEQGLILDANQAMADLFGYELSEFIGMNLLNLAMPESRELIRNRLREGVLGPYEAAGRRKDGTAFVGEINSKPMPYQGRMARVTAIRDITERKRAEAAIAAEKERLAVTLRSIGDGVITTDTRGAIVIMNRVAEELTGWTQGEAEGKPLGTVFTIVSEMTREPCENPVAEVLATGAITELANYALLTSRDGSERVIADSGAPITDRDGKTIGVVLVFRDMTEKQKTMDAIQRAASAEQRDVHSPVAWRVLRRASAPSSRRQADRRIHASGRPHRSFEAIPRVTLYRHASRLHGGAAFRRPLCGGDGESRTSGVLPSGFRLRAVVRAALVPERHRQDRLHGRRLSRLFGAGRTAPSLLPLDPDGARGAFRDGRRPPAARWSDDELRIGA